jgi:hypothetical protein
MREAPLARLVATTKKLLAEKKPAGAKRIRRSTWADLTFPVLEMFHWRRVVFDEFHELESFDSAQQNSLQHLRASYRWGLTGTPPIDTNAGVIFMSSLFRIDILGKDCQDGSDRISGLLKRCEEDRLITESAKRFLDCYVRQNTSELPQIRLEEHTVLVQHTASERALYLAQAHDAPDLSQEDAFSEHNMKAIEKLLKLCSHFQAAVKGAANAEKECLRIGEQKQRRVVRACNRIAGTCHVLLLLQAKHDQAEKPFTLPLAIDKARWELLAEGGRPGAPGHSAAESLDNALREALATPVAARLRALAGHSVQDAVLRGHLSNAGNAADRMAVGQPTGYSYEAWLSFNQKAVTLENLLSMMEGQVREMIQNLAELRDAFASQEFFQRTLAVLVESSPGSAEARSCSICLEENLPVVRMAITPCAHTFCLDCLRETTARSKNCATCRHPLSEKDIMPIISLLKKPAAAAGPKHPGPADAEYRNHQVKYGTKFASMVRKLHELHLEDPTAKVILFCAV